MTVKVEGNIAPAGIAWRAAVVGIGYLFLLVLGGALLASLGASFPQADNGIDQLPWILVSGVVIGFVLGSLANLIPASRSQHILIWTSLLFLNNLSVAIEGIYFAPDIISLESFPFLTVQQLITAVGTSALITFLFALKPDSDLATAYSKRTWYSWLWRLATCTVIYVFLFIVVGRLNFELITRPFYEQQGGLDIPDMSTLISVETIRGILIVLSIVPFILNFRTTKRRLMVFAGLALFLVGGLVPLMLQVPTLPGFLLLASGWEIFLQLFPTGMAAAALLSL